EALKQEPRHAVGGFIQFLIGQVSVRGAYRHSVRVSPSLPLEQKRHRTTINVLILKPHEGMVRCERNRQRRFLREDTDTGMPGQRERRGRDRAKIHAVTSLMPLGDE